METVIPTIEELITQLEVTGHQPEAIKLAHIKKAVLGMPEMPVGRRPVLERPEKKEIKEFSPIDKGTPFARKGEIIFTDDPKTGEEKVFMYKMTQPMTIDELKEYIEQGKLGASYLVEQYNNAKDPKAKRLIKKLIDQYNRTHYKTAHSLAEISKELEREGYELLSHRINKIAFNIYEKISADVKEMHKAMSLEEIYELSKNAADFSENVKKFADVQKILSDMVQNFIKDYQKKSKELIKKGVTKGDAEVVLKLVRDYDNRMHQKIKELSAQIKR